MLESSQELHRSLHLHLSGHGGSSGSLCVAQVHFFEGIEIERGSAGIAFTCTPDGRPKGEAYVEFPSEDAQKEALKRHKNEIGDRYIELFVSSKANMIQVRLPGTPYDLSVTTERSATDIFPIASCKLQPIWLQPILAVCNTVVEDRACSSCDCKQISLTFVQLENSARSSCNYKQMSLTLNMRYVLAMHRRCSRATTTWVSRSMPWDHPCYLIRCPLCRCTGPSQALEPRTATPPTGRELPCSP